MRLLPVNFIPAAFTPSQRVFVEAWYSLTNVQSLDSHRIRTLNARLMLRELVEVCRLVEGDIIKAFHREAVASEALVVLEQDPIYLAKFPNDWRVLHAILKKPEFYRGEKAARAVELRVTAEDAAVRADAEYFVHLLGALKPAIDAAQPSEVISGLTSALLTDLTDRGFSVSNLYGFHKFFEAVNRDGTPNHRTFNDRFDYLIRWLQRPRELHDVTLRVSRAQKLIALARFGDWKFSASVAQAKAGNREEAALIRPGASIAFASRTVDARDYREAGATALRSWSSLTDQLLFDFIPGRLLVESKFRSVRQRDGRVDVSLVQEQIPNPREWTSKFHLREFSGQVEAILSPTCSLIDEDKRQIEAAMRYLRLGTESTSLEATFLTRWIALESLLRTVQPDNPVGGVFQSVANLMSVTFVQRMNGDLCSTARYFKRPLHASLVGPLGMANTEHLNARQFGEVVADPAKRADFLSAFAPWPLYVENVSSHGASLTDRRLLQAAFERHEQNVRWQVQRVYRVRNEIVHNASHSISLLSLASHLEYYLRTTARTVVRVLSKQTHIRSLRDLFHRVAAVKTRFDEDLRANIVPVDLLDPLDGA
jgi:hypothetical protein